MSSIYAQAFSWMGPFFPTTGRFVEFYRSKRSVGWDPKFVQPIIMRHGQGGSGICKHAFKRFSYQQVT